MQETEGLTAPRLALASALPSAVRPGVGTVGWIRDPRFDLTLILGGAALALAFGAAVTARPEALALLVFLDQWLLGYQHVIATFTRLTFDSESLRRHRFLVFGLPPLMLTAVMILNGWVGAEGVMSVYFYWQWFHYTRQSYGIERMYWRKAGGGEGAARNAALLYSVAVWGVLYRSFQGNSFLGMDLWWLPVPRAVVTAAGVVTLGLLGASVLEHVRDYRQGRLRLGHTLFLASHVLVFVVAYLAIPDVTDGWLVLNVWHNAQYLLVVWFFNTNRFKQGVDSAHRFLSTLSQPAHVLRYFLVCLGIAVVVYSAVEASARWVALAWLPALLIVSQTINFHHYVVDAVIWKLRKQPVREQLGLPA
jgi:hypothetical protein